MADHGEEKPENQESSPRPNTVRTRIKNGTVIMEFAEPTTGVYMSPIEALIIANTLIEKAITIVQNPPEDYKAKLT